MTCKIHSFELGRLKEVFRQHGFDWPEIHVSPLGQGHSNLTYLLRYGDEKVVLRTSPPPPTPPGAHDILREARIIEALGKTSIPTPEIIFVVEDPTPLGRPFFVMHHIDGHVISTTAPRELSHKNSRAQLVKVFIECLSDIHNVDFEKCGITTHRKFGDFNASYLKRVSNLLNGRETVAQQEFIFLYDALIASAPPDEKFALIHNDFRLENTIWTLEPRLKLQAVLDWELATVGNPMWDVGYFFAAYPTKSGTFTEIQERSRALLEDDFPLWEDVFEHYRTLAPHDVSGINWYISASYWKLAVFYRYGFQKGSDSYFLNEKYIHSFLEASREHLDKYLKH